MVEAGLTTRLPAAMICLALAIACGRSSGGSTGTPTAPTPTAGLPAGGPCGTLGWTASLNILNGAECVTSTSAVVLLNMRDRDGFAAGACSGTVISERAILTAAHCLSSEVRLIRIFLGSGPEIIAESFTAHPAYRGGGDSTADVGVVVMAQSIGRTPAPLLLGRDARVGEPAIIAGWGRNQNDVPATLRAGLTAITAAGRTLLETQFGPSVSSICSGDSGGPILLFEGGAWAVGGVTSATSENVCNTGTNYYVTLRNASVSSFVLGLVPDAAQR